MSLTLLKTDDTHRAVPEHDWEAVATTLTRYVRGRTNRRDLVEDIVQETLSRLVQQSQHQKLVSVFALGIRIASNLLIDHHRLDQRYGGEPEEQRPSDAPLPDQVVAGKQQLAILSAALAAMPPLRRDVIMRKRLYGQSCATIARELELSLKAVEKHITRGLADLHRAMVDRDQAGEHGL